MEKTYVIIEVEKIIDMSIINEDGSRAPASSPLLKGDNLQYLVRPDNGKDLWINSNDVFTFEVK